MTAIAPIEAALQSPLLPSAATTTPHRRLRSVAYAATALLSLGAVLALLQFGPAPSATPPSVIVSSKKADNTQGEDSAESMRGARALHLAAIFADGDCSVSAADKVDCGHVGDDQDSCQASGCCWGPVDPNPNNEPWCYRSAGFKCAFNPVRSSDTAPFSLDEVNTMTQYFMANINIQGGGGVVASPDPHTPGGSYYYAWARDGALSMNTLWEIGTHSEGGWVPGATVDADMQAYVKWVLARQSMTNDPNGIDVRIEPKWELPAGDYFTGGWCRPQTDGPSLRAITLITYANYLLKNGQEDYVRQNLWTANGDKLGGAIRRDLEWVEANWASEGCDLWEEIRSTDFFWNKMGFKKALLMGAELATTLGDASTATGYVNAAAAVNATIPTHFNGQYLYEADARPQDGAVICALNDAYWAPDAMYGPLSREVALTIASYTSMFCSEYSINQADNKAGVPGMLLGRYKGDNYAGGNPWVLITAALAQLFYRGALEAASLTDLPENDTMQAWKGVLEGVTVDTPAQFSAALFSAGDAVLERLRRHTDTKSGGFHMAEQMDRNTGVQMSAADLTWSYAAVLKAMRARAFVRQ